MELIIPFYTLCWIWYLWIHESLCIFGQDSKGPKQWISVGIIKTHVLLT